MHVHYVTISGEDLASFRMRIKIPAQVLASKHHKEFSYTCGENPDPEADVNVFSKHFNKDKDLFAAHSLKGKSKVVFDICDDYFEKSHHDYYVEMTEQADTVVCNSGNMVDRVKEVTGVDAVCIGDPYSFPLIAPDAPAQVKEPNIIWYGNRANLNSILSRTNELPNLTIVSNSQPVVLPPHVKYRTWFPGLVEQLMWEYQIVVIPRIEGPAATKKSCNRAVDALRAGAFVVTDFPEVFEPLKDYIFIGDLESGVQFYKDNPDEVARLIGRGQEFVSEEYTPEKIANEWYEKVFK